MISIVQFIVSTQVTQKSLENSTDYFFSFKRKMNEQMNEQVNVGSLPILLSSKEILHHKESEDGRPQLLQLWRDKNEY